MQRNTQVRVIMEIKYSPAIIDLWGCVSVSRTLINFSKQHISKDFVIFLLGANFELENKKRGVKNA
jgi:hypothetical protein